jgi:predicted nucleic-acid-binding Zn-ribbon protein
VVGNNLYSVWGEKMFIVDGIYTTEKCLLCGFNETTLALLDDYGLCPKCHKESFETDSIGDD